MNMADQTKYPLVEVESHRVALGRALESISGAASVGGRLRGTALKYAVPIAVAALLVGSCFLVINQKPHERVATSQPGALTPASDTSGIYSIMATKGVAETAAVFKSIEDAEKVVHMSVLQPVYTIGGRFKQALVGTLANMEPGIFITYDNGLQITANVWREPVDYQGRVDAYMYNDAQLKSVAPQGPPSYRLVDLRGGKAMVWGRDLYFWEGSIEYTLAVNPKTQADDASAIKELTRVATSMSGRSSVPPAGARISIPPNYVDIPSAVRMSGIKFRWPEYTDGAKVTGVYATSVLPYQKDERRDKWAYGHMVEICYDNGMLVTYKEPPHAGEAATESPTEGASTRSLKIAGLEATLELPTGVTDGAKPEGSVSAGGLRLHWHDGGGAYTVSFDGPSGQPPVISADVAAATEYIRRIAESMYR